MVVRGRPDTGLAQWVKTYNIAHSVDGTNFETPSGPHQGPTTDPNTEARTELTVPLVGRSFRVLPITWNNHISMRMEFEGCRSKLLYIIVKLNDKLIKPGRFVVCIENDDVIFCFRAKYPKLFAHALGARTKYP